MFYLDDLRVHHGRFLQRLYVQQHLELGFSSIRFSQKALFVSVKQMNHRKSQKGRFYGEVEWSQDRSSRSEQS